MTENMRSVAELWAEIHVDDARKCVGKTPLALKFRHSPYSMQGLVCNAMTTFDPFSRYIPLRVEARLDDVLMDYIYRNTKTTTTPSIQSAYTQSSRVRENVSSLSALATLSAAPLSSTSYQEPTMLWNAAQHHLPYIHAGSAKILNPGIAEQSLDEEPTPDAVMQVIGADPLFTHVTEGKPVKAVRVVNLDLASTQHSSMPLRSSTITPLRVQRSLLEPILADSGPTSQLPNQGFVVVGDIALFGISSLSAKFEKWEGPAPSGVVVLPDKPVSVERATLSEDFHLSSVISALEGTAFDGITFRNLSVYHQNYAFDTTKAIGWHFDAAFVINESCGVLHDVLSRVLGVSEPELAVHLFLGADGGWDRPPSLHSFTLEGIFAGIALKPVNGVVLSKIGVRLFGIRTMKYEPSPQSVLEYGFCVFGTMNLDIPGSTVPLSLEYEIREFGGTVFLGASIDVWRNPLGAGGLVVSALSVCTAAVIDALTLCLSYRLSRFLRLSPFHLHGSPSCSACQQASYMRTFLQRSKGPILQAAHSS